jgi:hypothetical protein
MKKLLFTSCLLGFLTINAWAQNTEEQLKNQSEGTDGWNKGGTITYNLNQVALTNWAAGGQNSIAINGFLSLYAHHKKGKGSWDNYLDLAYGTTKQGKEGEWLKNDDRIDFTSKYGRQASNKWYYAALLNLKSQMTKGYNYPNDSIAISSAFAPAYVTAALGLYYKHKDEFTAYIAPLTAKLTYVNDQTLSDAGAFGVEPGEKSRNEVGGYLRLYYNKAVYKNVNLQSKLELFSNYQKSVEDVDVNIESMVNLKISKYISANLFAQMIYDSDIDIEIDDNNDGIVDSVGPATQYKEVMGVGFSYTF